MAIDNNLPFNVPAYPDDNTTESIVIHEDFDDSPNSVTETEDGGVVVQFGEYAEPGADVDFSTNLATVLDEGDLTKLAGDLINKFEIDKKSRADWEKVYEEGVKLLGLKREERDQPWIGASGVTHPILMEAAVDFQSQAIGELFPAGGPVRTKLVGETDTAKTKQGIRVERHMNWMVTEEMSEYRDEMDRLLFQLPISGTVFKKTFWDSEKGRISSLAIGAEDFVVNFGARNLQSASRTHEIMRRDGNWIKKRVYSGFYRDVDLSPIDSERTELKKALHETVGETVNTEDDDLYTLIEVHCNLDLPGYEEAYALPYVVTIDIGSESVLSIYRNWLPDDESKQKRLHYTKYDYIPGYGFYSLGLTHLLGGIASGATSMLRQLIDAGTLNNLQAGFKTRGLRTRGERKPLAPGEFRDVDVPAGKIQDNLFILPFKEPSQVLFQLLGMVVEEGRRFSSSMDLKLGNMNQETPVGTALAILERNMKVMSAIQSRLHRSMKDEFAIMVSILQGQSGKSYPYTIEDEDPSIMESDFDQRIDVIPVSDPNASTSSHRIMKGQTALQMHAMAPPGTMNAKPLYRWALEQMEIPGASEIIPLESDLKPMDPISENMAVLTNNPVKAFMHQDHQAHIQVHMLGMQDPKVQGILKDSPQAQAAAAAMMAHVTEHVAYQYRAEIEQALGTSLPPEGQEIPPEIEAEMSRLVAQAATKMFERNVAEQQMIENEKKLQDPIVQQRERELDIEERKEEAKVMLGLERLALDKAKLLQKNESEDATRTQQAMSNSERVMGEILGRIIEAASVTEELSTKERIALVEKLIDSVNDEAKIISSERTAAMNRTNGGR